MFSGDVSRQKSIQQLVVVGATVDHTCRGLDDGQVAVVVVVMMVEKGVIRVIVGVVFTGTLSLDAGGTDGGTVHTFERRRTVDRVGLDGGAIDGYRGVGRADRRLDGAVVKNWGSDGTTMKVRGFEGADVKRGGLVGTTEQRLVGDDVIVGAIRHGFDGAVMGR